MSAQKALYKYYEKQLPKGNNRKRKNKKPEKNVEKACLKWMREHGFNVDIIEAKGGYNNTYGVIAVKAGFSDCVGNDNLGRGVYIEFKANGRRANVSEQQRQFLLSKIHTNAFAVVTDSVEHLSNCYGIWCGLYDFGKYKRCREFLLSILPKSKLPEDDGKPLFD